MCINNLGAEAGTLYIHDYHQWQNDRSLHNYRATPRKYSCCSVYWGTDGGGARLMLAGFLLYFISTKFCRIALGYLGVFPGRNLKRLGLSSIA